MKAVDGKKHCPRCGETKPADPAYFGFLDRAPDKMNYWCRVCTARAGRERYKTLDLAELNRKNREYYYENIERKHELSRLRDRRTRREVLAHYSGGSPRCKCCGEDAYEFLTIDHIDGGGNEHRRSINGQSLYYYLKRTGYPGGFQILCYNCNMAKGFHRRCPHRTAVCENSMEPAKADTK